MAEPSLWKKYLPKDLIEPKSRPNYFSYIGKLHSDLWSRFEMIVFLSTLEWTSKLVCGYTSLKWCVQLKTNCHTVIVYHKQEESNFKV